MIEELNKLIEDEGLSYRIFKDKDEFVTVLENEYYYSGKGVTREDSNWAAFHDYKDRNTLSDSEEIYVFNKLLDDKGFSKKYVVIDGQYYTGKISKHRAKEFISGRLKYVSRVIGEYVLHANQVCFKEGSPNIYLMVKSVTLR